ncbi:MAG: hypothetical protein ABII02_04610 [Candidatus Magasanikbacteria bacterium]
MNKKIVTAILGVMVILAGIATYFFINSKSNQPIIPAPQNTQQSLTPSEKYKNEKYEFELTFPSTWRGFKTSDRTVDLMNNKTNGFETNMAIDVIFDDKPLFVLVIVPKEKWDQYNHLVEKYIGEDNQNVYSYYINWEPEPDVIDRLNEIEAIGKTFKSTK